MNFLPGEIDGDTINLPIGPGQDPRRAAPEPRVRQGRRPYRRHRRSAARALRGRQPGPRSPRGHPFKAKIDVLESMGSEFYAYFVVESERVSASELEELAQDAGAADLPHSHEGSQVVARLDAESRVKQGQEAELWFDSQHLQLFDLESSESLLTPGNGSGPGQTQAGPAQPRPARRDLSHVPLSRSTGMPGVDARHGFPTRTPPRRQRRRLIARLRGEPERRRAGPPLRGSAAGARLRERAFARAAGRGAGHDPRHGRPGT